MYCNYCGKVVQDDANICAYCGKRLGAVIARKRLVRPRQGRKIAGVCLGFAEYFDLDVTLVRIVWLVSSVMTGIGLLSYPIAWVIMPEEPLALAAPGGNPPPIRKRAHPLAPSRIQADIRFRPRPAEECSARSR